MQALEVGCFGKTQQHRMIACLAQTVHDLGIYPSIQGGIDASADNADAKLTQLVSKYDMQKPFNVPREERTSGSIMGF